MVITTAVRGVRALPRDDIFDDVSLDVRQAEIVDLFIKAISIIRIQS